MDVRQPIHSDAAEPAAAWDSNDGELDAAFHAEQGGVVAPSLYGAWVRA
jgi:hypothetical protein